MTSDQPLPSTPVPKLPVIKTVVEALRFTFQNFGTLLRYSWPLLLMLAALSVATHWRNYPLNDVMASRNSGMVTLFVTLIWIAAIAAISIPWHRFVLLHEVPMPTDLVRSPRAIILYSVVVFGLWSLAAVAYVILQLLAFFSSAQPSNAARIAALLWGIATSAAVARAMIYLPALAIGNARTGINAVWSRTRGNTIRIAAGSYAALLPVLLFFDAFNALVGTPQQLSRPVLVLSILITSTIFMTLSMTWVTYLALAYRHFFGAGETEPRAEDSATS